MTTLDNVYLRFIVIGLLIAFVSGCSYLGLDGAEDASPALQGPDDGTAVDQGADEKADQELPLGTSSIEIVWEVPAEEVTKYHLSYGFSGDDLSQQAVLDVLNLEKIDHPTKGLLYRYVVRGMPSDKNVFFSLKAENRFGISPPSPVEQVAPQN